MDGKERNMPRMIHNLLCNVSRRYRAAHCQHVDELPRRIQRRLLKECEEMDPRSWSSVEDMMRDLEAECAAEESEETTHPFRKVASFA